MIAVMVLTLVGCHTVERARQTQKSVAACGSGTSTVARVQFDLRGRTLSQLVGFAMTNRPSVVSAQLAVEDARLALRELAADAPVLSDMPWQAPKVSLSAGYSESSPGTTVRKHDFATRGDPSAAVSLDLLVWDFGRYDARARAQAERVVAAEMNLVKTGYVVFDEVALAYFDYLENNALLIVAQTNEQRYACQLAYAQDRHAAGEANPLDVTKARLSLAQARQTLVSASNLVETSGATLMHALGLDASQGTYETVLGRPAASVDRVMRGFGPTTYDVEEAYAFARTNAPAMCQVRAQLRAASHAVDYAVADLMPSISLSTSFSWTDPLWFWRWGLSGVQSIFQGYRKMTAVERAEVALKDAATSVAQAEQDLSKAIELALAVRDNAVRALETSRAAVRSAKENYDMVTSQWGVGEVNRVEVFNSVGDYSTALGDRVKAFYTGQRAEAGLFAILGRYPEYDEGEMEVEK